MAKWGRVDVEEVVVKVWVMQKEKWLKGIDGQKF